MSAPANPWPDEIDEILAGDLTAALAYLTPAGSVVLTPVAPIGLRDRGVGTVGFTTSMGFGKKVARMRADPRVALVYHAREHASASEPGFVVVQGRATVSATSEAERAELGERAARYLGPMKRGRFWDRWLAAYYVDRVLVTIAVERILWWRDDAATGSPEVLGAPLGTPAPAMAPPSGGTASRVDAARVARRLRPVHRLVGWRGVDGFPVVVPMGEPRFVAGELALTTAAALRPAGPVRSGVLAHEYRPQLVGLREQHALGWLEPTSTGFRFAPHTTGGFVAPANKTLLLLANGFLARRGLRHAEAAAEAVSAPAPLEAHRSAP
jgi:nitroimidazol reductase NimA-like FMN-containing flavoprotein (pyridoxamine 5'-phosphate oxidase superfamily)